VTVVHFIRLLTLADVVHHTASAVRSSWESLVSTVRFVFIKLCYYE